MGFSLTINTSRNNSTLFWKGSAFDVAQSRPWVELAFVHSFEVAFVDASENQFF